MEVPENKELGVIGREARSYAEVDYIDDGFSSNQDALVNEMNTEEEYNPEEEGLQSEDISEEPMEDDSVIEEGNGELFAVVDINTRQMKVSPGALVMTDRLKLEVGEEVIFDHILLVASKDFTVVGRPLIKGQVYATVEAHDQTENLIVFKKKRRKTYQRQYYHSSLLTLLRINGIEYSEEGMEDPGEPLPPAAQSLITRRELREAELQRRRAIVPTYPKPKFTRMGRRNMNRKLETEKDKLLYVSKAAKARGSRRSVREIRKLYPDYVEKKKQIIQRHIKMDRLKAERSAAHAEREGRDPQVAYRKVFKATSRKHKADKTSEFAKELAAKRASGEWETPTAPRKPGRS